MEVKSNTLKWVKTVVILVISFLSGFSLNSFYSSVLDFSEILQTSVQFVSIGLSIRCLGACLGSLFAGILFNYGDRLIVCAGFLIIGGIAASLIATLKSIMCFFIFKFMIGVTAAVTKSGAYLILAEAWGTKSGPFIQATAFAEVASSVIAPLFFHPFLSEKSNNEEVSNLFNNSLLNNDNYNNTDVIQTMTVPSEIWIPYTVLGIAMNIAASLAISLQCYSLKENKKVKEEKSNEVKEVKEEKIVVDDSKNLEYAKIYKICVICCFCFMSFLIATKYVTFFNFWVMFVMHCDLRMTKSTGVLMLSAFSLSMGFGNLMNMILAFKVKPIKMLLICVISMLLGYTFVLFYGNSSQIMVWIGGMFVGIGLGSTFATMFTCLSQRVNTSNFINSLFMFSSNLANAFGIPALIGLYMAEYPFILILCNVGMVSLIFVKILIVIRLDKWKEKKNF